MSETEAQEYAADGFPAYTTDEGTEAAKALAKGSTFDPNELRMLDSFEAAASLVEQTHGITAADAEIGDGFSLLENKGTLVGVPLIFMEWTFNRGDFGEFVSARVAAKSGNGFGRYILNDGSTGICVQLRDYTNRTGKRGGLIARHGLRVSEYDTDKDGVPVAKGSPEAVGKGRTYYIDTSA